MKNNIQTELVIDSVSMKETHKTDTDKEEHMLIAVNKDAATKIVITRPDSFPGFKPGQPLTVKISTEQTTL